MVDINLLPWRQYALVNRQRVRKQLVMGLFSISALLCGYYYWIPPTATAVIVQPIARSAPNIKYVGYVQQTHHVWALISLADGRIRELHPGSHLDSNYKIITIHPSYVVLAALDNPTHLTVPLTVS